MGENGEMGEKMMMLPYYKLKIYIDPDVIPGDDDVSILEKYRETIADIQQNVEYYITGNNFYVDSGFDLFVPKTVNIDSGSISNKINHGIKCAMTLNEIPVAFYLYPRSSTGSKTPLRLSNSVGIIDSGYRGHIISLFDYCGKQTTDYIVNSGDRLVQICGPNLHPIYPVIVDTVEELGITERGANGFGSTGQ